MRTGKMMAMKRVCLQTMNQRLWSNQPNDLSSSFGTDVLSWTLYLAIVSSLASTSAVGSVWEVFTKVVGIRYLSTRCFSGLARSISKKAPNVSLA